MQTDQFYNLYFKAGIISTDTRKINKGDIFFALKGENFNGNLYAKKALDLGAKIAVVDEDINPQSEYCIRVEDCLTFMQDLALYHIKNNKLKIIALTGSNGKTTTKELLYYVLKEKYNTQATAGNLNNHIGVPLTILGIESDTDYSIIEMGANHIGEIEFLCSLAQPQIGLITNIGKAHLEGFGNFEGVKKAKSELYTYLKENSGIIFYNGEDSVLTQLVNGYPDCVKYNSSDGICTAKIVKSLPYLEILVKNDKETTTIKSKLFGDFNVANILAATAIGLHLNLNLEEIKRGLEKYAPTNLRSQVIQLKSSRLVLDCYNANPSSMSISLEEFASQGNERKIAILGGMKELGEYSHEEHEKIIRLIQDLPINKAFLLGPEFQKRTYRNITFCLTHQDILDALKTENLRHTNILIKGSRANELEKVGQIIKKRLT